MEFTSKCENPYFPTVVDLDPKEVQKLSDKLTLIDVRRADEFTGELGHVPGSSLITMDTIPSKIGAIIKNKPIVFICRSGNRSAQVAAFAQENGLSEVYNMKGGMLLWNEYGLKIEK